MKMRAITIINWIVYGILFFAFFIKATDKKDRGFYRKTAYITLTFFSLFMSVIFFKDAFLHEIKMFNFKIRLAETIFNCLVLFLMITKIREDKIFNIFRK